LLTLAPPPAAQDLGAALPGLAAAPALAEEVLNSEEQKTVNLFQENTPGVVFITTEAFQIQRASEYAMRLELKPQGSGSGWVFDDEGHIVTNYHVIKDAEVLLVRFIDGTEVTAKVVGADPGSDVAVLQVDLPKGKKALLKTLVRGDSTSLRVGQQVFAIGNPFGLDHTLTKGIISGVGRTIMSVGNRPIQGVIQTDASINPGNSGGPLLSSSGKVIGMNTAIFSPSGASSGVGFAIPSDTVAARVGSILKYGYVKRPSLGLYLGQDGTAQRLIRRDGAAVLGMSRASAASGSGIRSGDIITKIGGSKVKGVNDVFAALDERQPGDVVEVTFFRPVEENPDGTFRYGELSAQVHLGEASGASA